MAIDTRADSVSPAKMLLRGIGLLTSAIAVCAGILFWYAGDSFPEEIAAQSPVPTVGQPISGTTDGSNSPARWAVATDQTSDPNDPYPTPAHLIGVNLLAQTEEAAAAKSAGCYHCHKGSMDPHCKDTLRIGCTDCHGGNAQTHDKIAAHVHPRVPEAWKSSANPVRSYTLLNHESPEFIMFVNPGDFRVAHIACGMSGCHPKEVATNRKQIMTTGCMLWGAALYNNGSIPNKRARYGELYGMNGAPLRLQTNPPPTQEEMDTKGVVPFLDPLPRYEMSQPGNILRIFERGGRFRPEVGIPELKEEPGRPRTRLSERGLGTQNRTDPVFVSLNKTRLFDPTLNFMGTNDHPGDYRSSGCTACHVIYANDRSPVHSGPYAKYGNKGLSVNPDPTVPKNERGHPIEHKFVNTIPTSQCMICHTHPGTTVMNSYIGYMWYDEETDGQHMYPSKQKYLSAEELVRAAQSNPDEHAARGNWGEREFLHDITNINPALSKHQFGDFHSHGWVYRTVWRHDKEGNQLDHDGKKVSEFGPKKMTEAVEFPTKMKDWHKDQAKTMKFTDPKVLRDGENNLDKCRADIPVHYMDIHMEKGMHCVDCHFSQDMHGNGRLHMEVRAAIEIQCIDCHGTSTKYTTLKTSGPANYTSAPDGQGRNLAALRTPFGKPRFERRGDRIFQNSCVEKDLAWECVQTMDTLNPEHGRYNPKSAMAKSVRWDGDGKLTWGTIPANDPASVAHQNSKMSCIACHSAWNPSCSGCHLPQRANVKMPNLHNDGDVTRNYTPYNFQTLRDDIYMLAKDGDATGNRIGPSRSSCAIHVGSYNGNREGIYVQQQTISGEGLSGVAFSTNVPHTVRGRDGTKQCTDCHISKNNDNNAWMTQLLMQGTGYTNFMGRYCWVASGEEGLHAVVVTEREEPQAVIGSSLHAQAYPDFFKKHVKHHEELEHAWEHPGIDISKGITAPFRKRPEVLSVQLRGEYVYAACGEGGLRMFDVAFIDDKAFAERITTAPVSPLGQKFYVPTKYAQFVAAPTTIVPDPTRTHLKENKEQLVPAMYAYVYVADKYEGLIMVGVGSMLDGNPSNNFLKKDVVFNPDGILNGAKHIQLIGHYAYVSAEAGLVVVDVEDPTKPKVASVLDHHHVQHPHMVANQFRYAYVVDEEGIKVLDITDVAKPKVVSLMRIPDLHSIYLARTYAYVAAGKRGLMILDIKQADRPKIDQIYNAEGEINDCHDVKLGITYVSEMAYIADGKNGMRIVQLTGPETPGNDGFSPRPTPKLIATYKIPKKGHALSITRGLDRDRAVDEAGKQIAVFGRVGARPFNKEEQETMYMKDGKVWVVADNPDDPIYRKVPYEPSDKSKPRVPTEGIIPRKDFK